MNEYAEEGSVSGGIVCAAGMIEFASTGFTKDGISLDKMMRRQISFDEAPVILCSM
ncbi:hypothetical protein [Ectobacillus panaciterrae]|uniref:hypothetical protein n=1 Tax=Ectobacillus panaciterrae TaxID=363872 RepID=UPI0003F7EDEF|nr:hypothetical protein [Ectobacillus panaciterrae]